MSEIEWMVEAERRGLLNDDDKSWLDEARRRGLVEPSKAKPEATFGGGVRTAVQGLTLGTGDEIEAGLGAAKDYLTGSGPGYSQRLADARQSIKDFGEARPILSTALEIGGSVPTMFIPGAGAARAATFAGRLGQGAKVGAITGGAYGFNSGEGGVGNRVANAAEGAMIGGAVGPVVAEVAAPVVGSLVSGAKAAGRTVGNAFDMAGSLQASADEKLSRAIGRNIVDSVPMTTQDAADYLAAGQAAAKHGSAKTELPEMLADIGTGTQRLARAVEAVPGAGAAMAREELTKRHRGQFGRMIDQFKQSLGVKGPNYYKTKNKIIEEQRTVASPAYSKAFLGEQPFDLSGPIGKWELKSTIEGGDLKAAVDKALGIFKKPLRKSPYSVAVMRGVAPKPTVDWVPNPAAVEAEPVVAAAKPKTQSIGEIRAARRGAGYQGPPLTDAEIETLVGSWNHIRKTTAQPKPRSLTQFVIDNGGVYDPGGDVLSMAGGYKGRPGLVRRPRGDNGPNMFGGISRSENDLDAMAQRAWENGYFPNHTQRPTVNEFLDALGEDLHTGNIIHPDDAERLIDRQIAEEMESVLESYGISSRQFKKESSLRAYFGQKPKGAQSPQRQPLESAYGSSAKPWEASLGPDGASAPPPMVPVVTQPKPKAWMPLRAFDGAKRAVDNMIEKAQARGANSEVRLLTELKNDMIAEVDKSNGLYRSAREEYSSRAELLDAMDLGRKAFRGDTEVNVATYKELPKAEKKMFKIGMAQEARKSMANKRFGEDLALMFDRPASHELFQEVMSDGAYEKFMALSQREARMAQTKKAVLDNSQTARIQQDVMDLNPFQSMGRAIADKGPIGAVVSKLGDWVQRAFQMREAEARLLARDLFETKPERQKAILDRIEKRYGVGARQKLQQQMNRLVASPIRAVVAEEGGLSTPEQQKARPVAFIPLPKSSTGAPSAPTGVTPELPTFKSDAEVRRALASGALKRGDRFRLGDAVKVAP